jgi:hypothetical protein
MKIQTVRSDAAGTLLRRGTFSATRGAYHWNGFDPSFTWNLWKDGRLVEVATSRKDAEKWLKEQEIGSLDVIAQDANARHQAATS